MDFKTSKTEREAELGKHSAKNLMDAMVDLAKAETPQERDQAREKLKLTNRIIQDISRLPKRAVLAGVMCLKAKLRKRKILASAAMEIFISEAPFDAELKIVAITDLGLAWRFKDRIGNVLYDPIRKSWLVFDGQRWNVGAGNAYANRAAQKISKEIVEEVNNLPTLYGFKKEQKIKLALGRQQRSAIENMLKLAQPMEGFNTHTNKFDRDPWLLNCKNGTIDLRTGELLPHNRNNLITKMCPVEYDKYIDVPENPNRCERWYTFLDEVTEGDKEFQKYLQMAAGYSLTGKTDLDIFFMLLGPTKTGKGTFVNSLYACLGDYAKAVSFEMFLEKKFGSGGGHRADLAELVGARLVIASEADEHRKFNVALVKALTGGDPIAAAFKYGKWFQFLPQFKVWLATNEAPRIPSKDEAMWERIVRLPFKKHFKPKVRDPKVRATLTNPKIAGATILHWAVQGCLFWQENPNRIRPPEVVDEAHQTYRDEMNPLKDFLEEKVVESKSSYATCNLMWMAYEKFGRDNGIRFPMKRTKFREQLLLLGYKRGRKGSGKGRKWIWKNVNVSKI